MASQVTTKRGDKGFTTALNGKEYPKSHPIMECVGNLDELRTYVALTCTMLKKEEQYHELSEFLNWLLHIFFVIGADCSDPLQEKKEFHPLSINDSHITRLEAEQAKLEKEVNLPRKFIVGASTLIAAHLDICCTLARRFERSLVSLKEALPNFPLEKILIFTNRLSDYLFIAARWAEKGDFQVVEYQQLK